MFKVGDRVRFIADTYHAKNWPGEFIVIEVLDKTTRIQREGETYSFGGYYHSRLELATPITPIDKQAAVIAKIKYLNQRFEQRSTCHV